MHFSAREHKPTLETLGHHIKLKFSTFGNPSARAVKPASVKLQDSTFSAPECLLPINFFRLLDDGDELSLPRFLFCKIIDKCKAKTS